MKMQSMSLIQKFKESLIRFGYKPKNHPDIKRAIEPVFVTHGVQYYQFKDLLDMPAERYLALLQLQTDMDLKIDRPTLLKLLDKQEEWMNAGNMTQAVIINNDLKRRASLVIEIDTLYRMASCLYFNLIDNEDLYSYDYEYNTKKIEAFRKEKIGDFFLRTPIGNYIKQANFSTEDLDTLARMTLVEKIRSKQILDQKPSTGR
jgi:hypothetical protein